MEFLERLFGKVDGGKVMYQVCVESALKPRSTGSRKNLIYRHKHCLKDGLDSGYDALVKHSPKVLEKLKTKTRSDLGRVILTQRDFQILLWMGEQYAIRFDHLEVLAGALAEDPLMVEKGRLGYKAAYRISTRWVRAGLVEREKIFVRQPMWLWLTKAGLETIDLELSYRVPAISRLSHIHAVNAVRMHVEQKVGPKARWVCEREANGYRKAEGKKHLVDGELEYQDGSIVGIEVELTQKRKTRLNSILRELKKDYDTAWYFASDESINAVKKAIARVPSYKETFLVYPLTSVMDIHG